MAIELVTKYANIVDEKFKAESRKSLITNNDYEWNGAHTVSVYTVTTAPMNDYDRKGTQGGQSRYGEISGLDAPTEEMTLTKDRSFTFAIDTLDDDETGGNMKASSALERQIREIVIPEVDSYTYNVMCEEAGTKAAPVALNKTNIYEKILDGSNSLDNEEVPELGRILIVCPNTYTLLKQSKDITMETDIGNEMRIRGVIGMIDGMMVIKVPAIRLPKKFGFLITHPRATVAPTKLESYKIHKDPPGISGSLVEGRICYDTFVLYNKAKAIYYQGIT